MSVKIINSDAVAALMTMESESINCCVTSPPYWGLRDYGIVGQIGLEDTYIGYIDNLIAVFRQIKRVLRQDGTLWFNLGDSYAAATKGSGGHNPKQDSNTGSWFEERTWKIPLGLKPKDLVGIPWRVAFALQEDGWWLRQDIIWSKPNPMPESVTDRCTKAHEYLFLLSKSARYYYDYAAIQEDREQDKDAITFRGDCYINGEIDNAHLGKRRVRGNKSHKHTSHYQESGNERMRTKAGLLDYSAREQEANPNDLGKRNKRSVWTVATSSFHDAHFATFPPALIEPCILAGCPKGGTVIDPFGGAGTTGLVADRLGRNAILIELNNEYSEMARRRIIDDAGMFASVS